MSKETVEKKGLGWFKGNRVSDSNDTWENIITEKEAFQTVEEVEDSYQPEVPEPMESAGKSIFSKENQDKISLDLIVAVENLLKDRQLVKIKHNTLDKRLQEANEMITRYKQDLEKRDELLNEKTKEIQVLENSLTNKQMTYDQLLEDYKEYQQNSNTEYEQIVNQLETSQDKYEKLTEEFTKSKYESMVKINELEEKIRSMEIANKKYASQYQQILDEKNELMQTINDFTERMSISFSPKTNTNSSEQA
jgi:chromosome segregation ATPase